MEEGVTGARAPGSGVFLQKQRNLGQQQSGPELLRLLWVGVSLQFNPARIVILHQGKVPLAILHFTGNATFHIVEKYALYRGFYQSEKVLTSNASQAAASPSLHLQNKGLSILGFRVELCLPFVLIQTQHSPPRNPNNPCEADHESNGLLS